MGLPALQPGPPDAGRAKLGRRLFFDPRLSADGKISCSSCHDPAKAFSDGRARAVGIHGKIGTRNAPSLLNVAFQASLFWDGRAADMEAQARRPLVNPAEHGLRDEAQAVRIVDADPAYRAAFAQAFADQPISIDLIASALAAFERTLVAGGSPFDRYHYGGDKAAMPEAAVRGLALFTGRAHCSGCHSIEQRYALFTDQKFHASTTQLAPEVNDNLPALARLVIDTKAKGGAAALDRLITESPKVAALGRFVVTQNPADIGQFKTPSLRNVAMTAPYMHDGSVATLEQAVETELYVRGAALSYPIVLTASEQQDLLAFLRALTSKALADAGTHREAVAD